MQKQSNRLIVLPYLNRWPILAGVALINVIFALLPALWGLSHASILQDAAICGATTALICTYASWSALKKAGARGELPTQVPISPLLQKMPASPLGFSLVSAGAAMVAMPLLTELLLRFYAIKSYSLLRFAVWKVAYSCVLAAKMTELIILRFTQPDCAPTGKQPQTGSAVVKNPLPQGHYFKNLFNTVSADFGFNLILGLLLGGTQIKDTHVVLLPTTRQGIVMSGLILGIIVTFRMAYPIAKQIFASAIAPAPAALKCLGCIKRLPQTPFGFSLALLPAVMLVSPFVFWLAFALFDFRQLDFFQFFIVRSLYVWLITKPVLKLAILRKAAGIADHTKLKP